MEPDLKPQEEKQHRKKEESEGPPPTSFKPLCPAKPSPSFLELPSTQWRPSQATRTGKGKHRFSPDHQSQECYGLLECIHNQMQMQTQIAQEQLALLEDMQESMGLLLSQQERKNGELWSHLESHAPKDSGSSPDPGS